MKKRLLSLALVLVLVLSMLPMGVTAEGEHIHCLCGANSTKGTVCADCGSEAITWTAWDGTTDMKSLASGNYYLTQDIAVTAVQVIGVDLAIDLCGHHITGSGSRFVYINGKTLKITDCTGNGTISGFANSGNNPAIAIVNSGSNVATLELYGGKITNNTSTTGNAGIINVTAGSAFHMYGGEISGNSVVRGTVKGGTTATPYTIKILGGTITGNTASGSGNLGGGAGIYSFSPVTVGGNAKVYGNTGTDTVKNQDIFLRNDSTYTGQLIVSSDKSLETGAQINYGLWTAETDTTDLQYISGNPTTWKNIWVSYDGQKVGHTDGTFFVDNGPADTDGPEGHFHCLCGQTKTYGATCSECGTEVAEWTGIDTMPAVTESGYYYLTADVSVEPFFVSGGEWAFCLCGHTMTSAAGKRMFNVDSGAVMSFTDCSSTPGIITGATGATNYGAVMRANAGSYINIYGGKITGNTGNSDGLIYAADEGTVTMYGGEVSGNTCKRGTFYAPAPSAGKQAGKIRILGGTVTGNAANGTGNIGGGAGVYSFVPVEVGGSAVISGNTAVSGAADILLRNDNASYSGSLVISTDVPVTEGANICYGAKNAEADLTDLQAISGSPAAWESTWVFYDGQKVGYADGKFFIDTSAPDGHIHCLCGAETTEGATCGDCGSKAAEWTAWEGTDTLPTTTGYYYLTADVTTGAVTFTGNVDVALCLCGHNIISKNGWKIMNLEQGATVSITDCAETVGQITGSNKDTYGLALRINAGSTLNFYNGKITGNSGSATGDGIVYVDKGTADTAGGTFNMYGGEISGNTARRGIVFSVLASGVKPGVVRILGGTITGNTTTGTGSTTGGAICSFNPVEVGGDAKIYGNTAATAGTEDIYLRNDGYNGSLVVSATKPLESGANICYNTKTAEADASDLQCISGTPTDWVMGWVTYNGDQVGYKDGKFYTELELVYSDHDHDGHKWVSMTNENGQLPEATGYYVLDGDVTLPEIVLIGSGADVTLCLNGHTLTAAAGTGHFDVRAGGKLTICDCTDSGVITGGNGANGGSIRARAGSQVYLYQGTFTGNTTAGNGGVIYMDAASAEHPAAIFHMYGGKLCDNYGAYGGAVRLGAPSAGLAGPTFRMEGGTICCNESPNYGGAFHCAGGATVELIGGIIENNVAALGGGGMSVNGNSTVSLSGTVIRNNSAVTWGGGLYIKTGAVMNMTGGEVSGNSSKVGAGILMESAGTTLNLQGGKITGNKAGTAGGAGIFASTNTIVNMSGGEVSGNEAEAGGGGVSISGGIGNFTGGKITGNKASSGGAGLRLTGTETFLGNVIISDNVSGGSAGGVYVARESSTVSKVTIDGAQILNNTAKTSGGGMYIYMNGNEVTMESGKIHGNKAADGGGICAQREVTVTINGGEITSNTVTANGGGYYASIDSTFIFNGGLISGNYATKSGGGVYCLRSKVYLNRGSISNNYTEKGSGAGVYVSCAKAELNGTWITNNTCKDASGAGVMVISNTMKVDGVPTRFPATLTINAGRISGNFTPRAGAGLLLQSKDTVVNMYGGKITENTATKFAAGVYVGVGTMFNMHGGEVSYNVSENDVAAGIRHDGGGGNYTGGEIHHNVSPRSGGGLVVGGTGNKVTMKNVKIYANEAKVGGGFVQQSKGCQLIMENCEIYDNKSTQEGAGAYIYTYCDYYATNCHFHDNVTQGNGGALWSWATSYVYLTDCTIENNEAKGQGGAIWTRGDGFFISGCTIRNNKAAGDGGAVYAGRMSAASDGFKPHMNIDTTVIENNESGGQGGGMYLASGAMGKLSDVSFLNNKAAAEAGAFWVKDEFSMHNVTATGNQSGGEGYAVYLDDSEYDGHSYIAGLMEMSGSMKIHDNPGGDMYLGKQTALTITELGIAEDTKINITLHSGLLTQMVWGAYDYEGGDLIYTITHGNRSIVDPELPSEEPVTEPTEEPTGDSAEEPTGDSTEQEAPKGNTGLIVGIIAIVVVILAAALIIILAAKKKKSDK